MKEPKYKIGQKVWYIYANDVRAKRIRGIFQQNGFFYCVDKLAPVDGKGWLHESNFFPDKQSLIESL